MTSPGGSQRGILACILVAALTLIPGPARAELLPLALELNGQNKPTVFAERRDDGTLLLSVEDWHNLGLTLPDAPAEPIDGNTYLPVTGIDGISASLDEASLTLRLQVRPDLLPGSTLSAEQQKTQRLLPTAANNGFVNYAIEMQAGGRDSDRFERFSTEIGWRFGDLLLQSDGFFLSSADSSDAIRLNSSLIGEQRDRMTRWTAGDLFTRAGAPGGTRHLGGIAYERRFRINPYFTTYPTLQVSGAVATPSTIEVYLDGNRVLQETLPPGPFNIANIQRYRGAGDLEVVLRDAYGREERIREPFYLSDRLLARGLHDFSYAIGAAREEFGLESFAYGEPELQLFHDYGRTENQTVGIALEAGSDLLLLAPRMAWKVSRQGIMEHSVSIAKGEDGVGFMLGSGYSHLTRNIGVEARLSYASSDHATLASRTSSERPEWLLLLSTSYNRRGFGSLTLKGAYSTDHRLEAQQQLGLIYSRALFSRFSLVASLLSTSGRNADTQFLLSLNYQPRGDMLISLTGSGSDGHQGGELQVEKTRPIGEGGSYRLRAAGSHNDAGSTMLFNPLGEYRGRHGIYQAELQAGQENGETTTTIRLGASGALVRAGGIWGVTRPVRDSFALVQVGQLPGVEVSHNHRPVGRTDEQGRIFLPEVTAYFDNQVTINDREIPIDYALTANHYTLTPQWRSGSCLYFSAVRFRPLVGRLAVEVGKELRVLEYHQLTLHLDNREVILPTGRGGEFYLDPEDPRLRGGDRSADPTDCSRLSMVAEGNDAVAYRASIEYNGRTYPLELTPPAGEAFFADLGTIVINRPAGGHE